MPPIYFINLSSYRHAEAYVDLTKMWKSYLKPWQNHPDMGELQKTMGRNQKLITVEKKNMLSDLPNFGFIRYFESTRWTRMFRLITLFWLPKSIPCGVWSTRQKHGLIVYYSTLQKAKINKQKKKKSRMGCGVGDSLAVSVWFSSVFCTERTLIAAICTAVIRK